MPDEALALSLAALARKERTVAEMGRWLRDRGVGEVEVEDALEHLCATGALDDARFAARFAADKRDLSGWGGGRIRATLLERGVPEADVEAALAEGDADAELDRAQSLLRDREFDLSDDRGRGKALAMLVRRGYDSELAYEAVRCCEREP